MIDQQQIAQASEYYNTVRVDDYYDKVHRSTWARRTAATLGGATQGAIYGAIIGAVCAFLPWALGALAVPGAIAVTAPGILAILSTAGIVASVAGLIGVATTHDVGSNAASIAAGLEEMEKRHRFERYIDGMPNNAPQPTRSESQDKNTPLFSYTGEESPLFSWKVAAITGSLSAAFGALVGFSPVGTSTVAAVLGKLTVTAAGVAAPLAGPALVIASAVMIGLMGATTGLKNSLISNRLSNFYFKIISNQPFMKTPATLQPATQPEKSSAPDLVVEESLAATKSFADNKKRFSLSDLITRRQEITTQDATIRR